MNKKTNKWVLDKIGSVLMLKKSMAERKMRFLGHIVRKNGIYGEHTDTGESGNLTIIELAMHLSVCVCVCVCV